MDMKNKSFKFIYFVFFFIERRIVSHCQILWVRLVMDWSSIYLNWFLMIQHYGEFRSFVLDRCNPVKPNWN